MPSLTRICRGLAAVLVVASIGSLAAGCGESVDPTETTAVPGTPAEVIDPQVPDTDIEAGPATDDEQAEGSLSGAGMTTESEATTAPDPIAEPEAVSDEPSEGQAAAPSLVVPADLATAQPAGEGPTDAGEIELVAMDFETFRKEAAVNPDAKLTVVDAWATWCGPCKENFPHLVEMHEKYKEQGLSTVSLALELEPDDPATIRQAEEFLREQGATFTNVVISGDVGDAFNALDVNTIPAVFLYGPGGEEIGRFTIDDPNNQFDYEGVEQVIAALLEGESAPQVRGYFPAEGGAEE